MFEGSSSEAGQLSNSRQKIPISEEEKKEHEEQDLELPQQVEPDVVEVLIVQPEIEHEPEEPQVEDDPFSDMDEREIPEEGPVGFKMSSGMKIELQEAQSQTRQLFAKAGSMRNN